MLYVEQVFIVRRASESYRLNSSTLSQRAAPHPTRKRQMASARPFLREQLTATEIRDAQVSLCKFIQHYNYEDEIGKLQEGKKLSKSNVLRKKKHCNHEDP